MAGTVAGVPILFCGATAISGPYCIYAIIKTYWPKTVNVVVPITAMAETEKILLSMCPLGPLPGMKKLVYRKLRSWKMDRK